MQTTQEIATKGQVTAKTMAIVESESSDDSSSTEDSPSYLL